MAIVEVVLVLAFALLVVVTIVYALIKSDGASHSDVDPKSRRLARMALLPRRFDPLVARPLKPRETVGILVLIAIMITAIALFG